LQEKEKGRIKNEKLGNENPAAGIFLQPLDFNLSS
jgi:hypothetical protein